MSDKNLEDGGKLGFLDSLGRLFRSKPAGTPEPAAPQATREFGRLEADFEAAMAALNKRLEAQRRTTSTELTGHVGAGERGGAQDRGIDRQARKEARHRAMREDIEKLHGELRTGISGSDLDEIVAFLRELDADSKAGRDSHALLPRARRAIAERLRVEAGELAVARVVAAVRRESLDWPDPTYHRPSVTPEEIEKSTQRRLKEIRENFLQYDFARIAERLQGIVAGWGGDYPDRGSPLWQETALTGVAAGIWGRLLQHFVERLRQGRETLISRTEELVGKELAMLHATLEKGATSIPETTEAVASSLRVLDEVVPEIAWALVGSELPEERPGS